MPKTIKPETSTEQEVQMDRRRQERRSGTKPEAGKPTTEFKEPRRRKERRRQIDPTTCERDYNSDEIVFMQALDAYKRSSGRMFPTCSEILEVVRGLGYVKLSEEEQQLLTSIADVEADLAECQEIESRDSDSTESSSMDSLDSDLIDAVEQDAS